MGYKKMAILAFVILFSFSCSKNDGNTEIELKIPEITDVKINGVSYENLAQKEYHYNIMIPEEDSVLLGNARLFLALNNGEFKSFDNDPQIERDLTDSVKVTVVSANGKEYQWVIYAQVEETEDSDSSEIPEDPKPVDFGQITIRGIDYDISSLDTTVVGKDIMYIHLVLEGEFYADFNVLLINVNDNNDFRFEAIEGEGTLAGRESPLVVAQNRSDIIAVVNADYYIIDPQSIFNYVPLGANIVNGKIFSTSISTSRNTVFGFERDNTPYMGRVNPGLNGFVRKKGGEKVSISDVNRVRNNNSMVVFTPDYGFNSTLTSQSGVEVTVKLANNKNWKDLNDYDSLITVVSVPYNLNNKEDSKVTDNGMVISGRGSDNQLALNVLKGYNEGDTILVSLNYLTEKDTEEKVTAYNLLGGGEIILVDGEITTNDNSVHPRTGIGYTNDKKTVAMIVAVGRYKRIKGVTLREFADVFTYFGIDNAMNLDGGGSSNMIINGERVNKGNIYIRPVSTMFAIVEK